MKLTKKLIKEMIEEVMNEGRIKIPFIKDYMTWDAQDLKDRVLMQGGMHKRRPAFEKEVQSFFELNPDETIDVSRVFRKPARGQKSRFTKWTGSSPDKYNKSKPRTWTLNVSNEFGEIAHAISLVIRDQIMADNPELQALSDWASKFTREETKKHSPNHWKVPRVEFHSLLHNAINAAMKNQYYPRGLPDARGSVKWQMDELRKVIARAQALRDAGGEYEDDNYERRADDERGEFE